MILFKKGNPQKIENYRPITLSSNMSKKYMKIMKNRIEKTINFNQPIDQAEFRKGFSTIDHLHVLNQLIL